MSRPSRTWPGLLLIGLFAFGPASSATAEAFEWEAVTPDRQGMATARLDSLWEGLRSARTTGLLVCRGDRIVYERYADGWGAAKPHYTASAAKAVVGGLALAVAIGDGRISLDDHAAKFIPGWRDVPLRSKITIRQLGSHTSGLDDARSDGVEKTVLGGWKSLFWERAKPPRDPFTLSRDVVPVRSEPGSAEYYSNPGIAMLGHAVTASLRGAAEADLRTLLRDRVMRPIGVRDEEWSIGYNQTVFVDDLPLVPTWGGGSYTPRALARVGRLMVREGDWDGTRLVAAGAVRQVTSDAGTPGHCGIGWWSNNEGAHPSLPRDAFYASGAGHQILLVVPSLEMVVVRNGEALGEGKDALDAQLFEPLMASLTLREPKSPYPPSPVLLGVAWDAPETIRRAARDSDIWAMTWADDDRLYTAYGDGTGFAPKVPEKLSLGLATIEGGPGSFVGTNLRSPSAESKGDGKAGRKASGMLMVGGTLYLLARNVGNSQLAWSDDHGATWTWADWKFNQGFGCPSFLNFGKDYAGARDDFVYIYSHDSDSAYMPADRLVLARVPKRRIRERDAYEFFVGVGPGGEPAWTSEIDQRGAVFFNGGRCYRTSVSYNSGLGRYLLCQTGADGPVRAGFAIFDAPEPWGPWTTVEATDAWDVLPGETCSFPPRWISEDGATAYLVFSGGDSFSVRRATFRTAGGGRREGGRP